MKRYPEYKDSDIELIGKIPTDWNLCCLKHLLKDRLMYGANESGEEENLENPRYIRITDFGNDGRLREDTFKSLPMKIAKDYLLKEGDILFARSGATVGKTFQFKNYGKLACFAGYLIKATPSIDKMDSDFLYYYTKSGIYENWKDSVFIQATIQNIGADKYSHLPVPVPPLSQQKLISNFLKYKAREIDLLIAKKQRLIELLQAERTALINQAVSKGLNPNVPMKDSGIEWLGEIPEHWYVKRLKTLGKIRYGLGQPPVTKDNGLPVIRATNIQKGKIIAEDLLYADPDDLPMAKDPILKQGEIIVVRSGAYTGDSALIPTEYIGAVAGYDMVFTCINVNADFMSQAFLSDYILERQWIPASKRAAQPHLNAEELGSTLIVYPPAQEQEEIAQYLIKKETLYYKSTEKIIKEIYLLNEYKTALINEAVTGKIDVRNHPINHATSLHSQRNTV